MVEDDGRRVRMADCHPDRKHKARGLCLQCYGASYYVDNAERIRVRTSEYRQTRLDEARAVNRARYYNPVDFRKIMLARAKERAKSGGIVFDLAFDDFEIPEVCPVLGLPLARNTSGTGPAPNSPSLDRIDPSQGYVRGNVQVISKLANSMKQNASVEELRSFAHWVLREYGS